MKTYFKYILAAPALGVALYGCADLATPGSDTEESITSTYVNEEARRATNDPALTAKDCDFQDRKSTRRHTDQKGIVLAMLRGSDERDGFMFAIMVPETNQRFTACGLPDHMKRDGNVIVFSGEEKEIFPHEKWTAAPFTVVTATMPGGEPPRETVRDAS